MDFSECLIFFFFTSVFIEILLVAVIFRMGTSQVLSLYKTLWGRKMRGYESVLSTPFLFALKIA